MSPHKDNFSFLRMLAALLVLYSHQHALTGRPEPSFLGIHSWGGLGVLVFFSISGFLVTQSWSSDPNVARFAARRLLRIWPGYVVAVVMVACVLGPWVSGLTLVDYFKHPLTRQYLLNFAFLFRADLPLEFAGSSLPHAANGSLWTIPLELTCYAALAVLGWMGLLRSRSRAWTLALFLAALFAYAVWQPRGESFVERWALPFHQHMLLEFGLFFLAGVSLRMFWPWLQARRWSMLASCLALAVAAQQVGRPTLAAVLSVPALIVTVGTSSWPALRHFDRFGDLSYGTYLYAFPVQQTLIWSYRGGGGWQLVVSLGSHGSVHGGAGTCLVAPRREACASIQAQTRSQAVSHKDS